MSGPERQSYVETRKFKGWQTVETKMIWYNDSEAHDMYLKVVDKYRKLKESILVCLRDQEHQLIKCELIKPVGDNNH
jgi:acetone carboxylase gamma subunit